MQPWVHLQSALGLKFTVMFQFSLLQAYAAEGKTLIDEVNSALSSFLTVSPLTARHFSVLDRTKLFCSLIFFCQLFHGARFTMFLILLPQVDKLETLYSRVSEFPVKLTETSTLFWELSSAKVCGVKMDHFLHIFLCQSDNLHFIPYSFQKIKSLLTFGIFTSYFCCSPG